MARTKTETPTDALSAEEILPPEMPMDDDLQADIAYEQADDNETPVEPSNVLIAEMVAPPAPPMIDPAVPPAGFSGRQNSKMKRIKAMLEEEIKSGRVVTLTVTKEYEGEKALAFKYGGVEFKTAVGVMVKVPYTIYKHLVTTGRTPPQWAEDYKLAPQRNRDAERAKQIAQGL